MHLLYWWIEITLVGRFCYHMEAEGNSQELETTLQGSQKRNGEIVSEIRYKKEEGGL